MYSTSLSHWITRNLPRHSTNWISDRMMDDALLRQRKYDFDASIVA
jgi:hypothetical protein